MTDRLPGERPADARRRRALARALRGWTLTPHAADRAAELGFHPAEVTAAADRPEQTYGSSPGHPDHYRVAQRGDVAVVIDPDARTVITVLIRTAERWKHGVDTRATAAS